jgi:hypothetical protein
VTIGSVVAVAWLLSLLLPFLFVIPEGDLLLPSSPHPYRLVVILTLSEVEGEESLYLLSLQLQLQLLLPLSFPPLPTQTSSRPKQWTVLSSAA